MLVGDKFDMVMGILIILNGAIVGMQVNTEANSRYQAVSPDPMLDIVDKVCVLVYTVELGLRYFVYGFATFRNHWVQFDTVLVVSSWGEIIFAAPI